MDKVPVQIVNTLLLLKKSLNEKFTVKKVILFGSFAKGNYRDNSDIDVCVVIEKNDNNFLSMLQIAPIAAEIDTRIEAVVFSDEEYFAEQSFGILNDIKTSGIAID